MQLIDATQWFKPLRKNLGKKNCELSDEDIQRICDTFLAFEETEQSKIFPNAAFGYWKVTVERPLRLQGIDPDRAYTPKEIKALKETAERAEDAPPVIRKIHKTGHGAPTRCAACSRPPSTASPPWSSTSPTPTCATPSRCRCWRRAASRPSSAARCCPTRPTPGTTRTSVKIGYEISFTRYFYKPQPLRTLEEIRADILALEKETEGLLGEIIGGRRAMIETPKVYLAPGGKLGDDEELVLDSSSAIIGFREIPSLGGAEGLRRRVCKIVEDRPCRATKPRADRQLRGPTLGLRRRDAGRRHRRAASQAHVADRARSRGGALPYQKVGR